MTRVGVSCHTCRKGMQTASLCRPLRVGSVSNLRRCRRKSCRYVAHPASVRRNFASESRIYPVGTSDLHRRDTGFVASGPASSKGFGQNTPCFPSSVLPFWPSTAPRGGGIRILVCNYFVLIVVFSLTFSGFPRWYRVWGGKCCLGTFCSLQR